MLLFILSVSVILLFLLSVSVMLFKMGQPVLKDTQRLRVGVSRGFPRKAHQSVAYLCAGSVCIFVFPDNCPAVRTDVKYFVFLTPFSVQACAVCPLLDFSPRLFVTAHAQFVKVARFEDDII